MDNPAFSRSQRKFEKSFLIAPLYSLILFHLSVIFSHSVTEQLYILTKSSQSFLDPLLLSILWCAFSGFPRSWPDREIVVPSYEDGYEWVDPIDRRPVRDKNYLATTAIDFSSYMSHSINALLLWISLFLILFRGEIWNIALCITRWLTLMLFMRHIVSSHFSLPYTIPSQKLLCCDVEVIF